ncbi:hypothetical protein C6345_15475 [Bacillus sp. LNXM12-2]|uniref:Uncharacterized protein n=1 Tax=Bacillus pumilus TaxID=1408 RepID=A0AAE4B8Y8_BACPU|nr:hypothetical protein DKE43_00150 [Bacillus pumilus]PAC80714.1 hypothetical protein CHI05_15545 [Bacillus sp. 7788]PRS38101.1 hypothetical protein C6Y02_12120 [Bacillus sp. NMCC4]PRS40099.1 hypothetical protein C6Y01_15000 [Bacillus sp. NMCC46]PRS47771.1 hypothetical protein C6Y05_15855 [Bacillus sp. LNXM10]PRS48296.1 hypothetical protein C6Y00_13350 [Bacillus sp. GBSC66]PRS48445.1 hypothetical protein C6Y06_15550 [Bacillus sp. MZGC1]PRS57602.1 hypothetical protein C6344_17375 [Bacillus sp
MLNYSHLISPFVCVILLKFLLFLCNLSMAMRAFLAKFPKEKGLDMIEKRFSKRTLREKIGGE